MFCRSGIAQILAGETNRVKEKIGKGAEELAMHAKGNEIPMHVPRLKQGMGLHYSINAAGANDCTGIHDTHYILRAVYLQ